MLERPVKHVLVVEDDKDSRKAIEVLVATDGVQITGTGSGGQARDLIAARDFDCVILDLDLPDMTGCQLTGTSAR